MMKEIKAFIRPNRVEKTVSALIHSGYENLTIFVGEGTGSFLRKDSFPSLKFHITNSEVAKIEMLCDEQDVERIIQIICQHAHTHERGDGIIYISPVERLIKVKTGSDHCKGNE